MVITRTRRIAIASELSAATRPVRSEVPPTRPDANARLRAATPAAEGVSDAALLRLLQLCSPALPIGAFAYSQALEQAVELGWVNSEGDLEHWLGGLLRHNLAWLDLPLLARHYRVWEGAPPWPSASDGIGPATAA